MEIIYHKTVYQKSYDITNDIVICYVGCEVVLCR